MPRHDREQPATAIAPSATRISKCRIPVTTEGQSSASASIRGAAMTAMLDFHCGFRRNRTRVSENIRTSVSGSIRTVSGAERRSVRTLNLLSELRSSFERKKLIGAEGDALGTRIRRGAERAIPKWGSAAADRARRAFARGLQRAPGVPFWGGPLRGHTCQ